MHVTSGSNSLRGGSTDFLPFGFLRRYGNARSLETGVAATPERATDRPATGER